MNHALILWWQARAPSERRLIAVAAVAALALFAWLAVARPLSTAVGESRLQQQRAAEMLGAARASAKDAARPGARAAASAPPGPMDRWIADAAAQAGFTEATVTGAGDEARVSIPSARAQALFDWIAGLEARGARVVSLRAAPNAAGDSIAAEIGFARAGS